MDEWSVPKSRQRDKACSHVGRPPHTPTRSPTQTSTSARRHAHQRVTPLRISSSIHLPLLLRLPSLALPPPFSLLSPAQVLRRVLMCILRLCSTSEESGRTSVKRTSYADTHTHTVSISCTGNGEQANRKVRGGTAVAAVTDRRTGAPAGERARIQERVSLHERKDLL